MSLTVEAAPALLPIDVSAGPRLSPEIARSVGAKFHDAHISAQPFPHSVFDNFLPEDLARRILDDFPGDSRPRDLNFESGYAGFHKRAIQPGDCSEFVISVFNFFNSEPILHFLEGLTGIAGLIPDPYFEGGGFHEVSTGGLLGVHVDFRLNEKLLLQRRLNLILYLNPDWQSDWGGQLGLWDAEMKKEVRTVDPVFNRAVVFNTDEASFHGHPDPLACPTGQLRRSMALYYYTASQHILQEIQANSTIYVPRKAESAAHRYDAWRVRMYSRLKDWLPPVAFRALRKLHK